MIKISGSNNPKLNYSMKDTFLVFNINYRETFKLNSIDRKKAGKHLRPLGDYEVLCAGFY